MTQRRRLLGLLTALVFATLIVRMWSLQVVSADAYDDLAAGNRTRLIQSEGPRGRILDLNGRALADTGVTLTVVLDPSIVGGLAVPEREALFDELAIELVHGGHAVTAADLNAAYQATIGFSVQPIVVVADIDPGLWIVLEERNFPAVEVQPRPIRTYPFGSLASHVIGHLGTVADDDEVDRLNAEPQAAPKPYLPGDVIGRAGLEQVFETALRGTPEIKRVEIDAENRVVRTVEVVQEAAPGSDVHLTIDLDLQRTAEESIETQLIEARRRSAEAGAGGCDDCQSLAAPAGSLVAVRPDDGSVVALASYPTYDPSWFVAGLSQSQADTLFQDPHRPLLNRAVAGQYPAGSTFKPVTAYSAVTTGARTPGERWNDLGRHELTGCRSAERAGCVFRNAGSVAMGPVDLPAALARSSDTYFYSLGERFWSEREVFGDTPVQDTAELFGLGAETGIGLPQEQDGFVPTPDRREADGGQWYTGDNVNLAIGQGDLLVTPLQLANVYATLATGGDRYQPRLVSHLTNGATGVIEQVFEPVELASAALEPTALGPIQDGLIGATTAGTAVSAFIGFPLAQYPIAGKTGTAQVDGRGDYALFVGYGPMPAPEIVVAVVLEEAGFGGHAAAPAARSLLDEALVADTASVATSGDEAAPAVPAADSSLPRSGHRP